MTPSKDSAAAAVTAAELAGVVFDLDGVLTDTWNLYLGVYRKVFTGFLGREPTDAELIEKAQTTESGTLRTVLPPDFQASGLECFTGWYERLFDDLAAPYPRAVTALRTAKEKGKKVGVFTGKTRRTARFTLERLGVLDAVDCLSSEDDYRDPKPHHGGLIRILKILRLEPSETLYIGDQRDDLTAGRSAEVATAAALWARYTTIEPRRDAPDLVFATEESCLDFFRES